MLRAAGKRSWIKGQNEYDVFNAKVEYHYNSLSGFSLNLGLRGNTVLNKGYSDYNYENTSKLFYGVVSNIQDDELTFFATANKIFFLLSFIRRFISRACGTPFFACSLLPSKSATAIEPPRESSTRFD